jgi:hypothetical protein
MAFQCFSNGNVQNTIKLRFLVSKFISFNYGGQGLAKKNGIFNEKLTNIKIFL